MSNRVIQNLFVANEARLKASRQPIKHLKAIDAITRCRTEEMGVSYYRCESQHTPIKIKHSCRHRSCYLCAQKKRLEWIEKQKARLLKVPHFHVIFTLPHEYLNLWRYNEALFSRIIFTASQKTLTTLLADERHGGFKPGILMALHTWGRRLNLHPHTHCLVTAGGLDRHNRWRDAGDFLLPSPVIRQFYRGLVQHLIRQAFSDGELTLPPDMTKADFWLLYRRLYKKSWSVRIEERYEHGKGVALYLARYCKGGPVNPRQLTGVSHDAVVMHYLDHRDKRVKSQRLGVMAFLQRLLLHVPPPGLHTVRYYGLYAPAAKRGYALCYAVHGNLASIPDSADRLTMVLYCKTCGGIARRYYQHWPHRVKGNSINKDHTSGVQQEDEHDLAKMYSFDTS